MKLTPTQWDRRIGWILGVASIGILLFPLWMVANLLFVGVPELSLDFFWQPPLNAGRSGGVGSVIISTLLILSICLMFALPLALGMALFLTEHVSRGSGFDRWSGFSLDVLGGVPSIVFGLFGYQFFSIQLGFGFSLLSGGLTLTCMVLPLMVRSFQQAFLRCPASYRLAAASLGLSQTGFISKILMPTAMRGLVTGVILSSGRALSETAVLLFTSGYVTRMPHSIFDSGRSLSVHIYDLSMNVPGGATQAAKTGTVLLIMILTINLVAHRIGKTFQTHEFSQ